MHRSISLLFAIPCSVPALVAAQPSTVRSPADLPPTRFVLPGPPSEAFLKPAFVDVTIPQLRAEAEHVRAHYRIADQALAQELRNGLASIALLQGRPADVRALVAESRQATEKPQLRAIGMLTSDAAAAILEEPATTRCARAASRIATVLNGNDATLIRDEALGRRVSLEVASGPFLAGIVKVSMDPGAASNGGRIGLRDGLQLAVWRAQLDVVMPCRVQLSQVIRTWADQPGHRPANIWTAREPAPAALRGARPVVAAVWDSGVDPALFPGQLATDSSEPIDGRDNDGDGIIDDWNGPTYDAHMQPDPSPLKRPSAQLEPQLAFQLALMKGNLDLGYGLDTPEAQLFSTRSREAGMADQESDTLLWDEVHLRSHGTGVASEIADGNSFVRLFSVTAQPWGNDPHEVITDEALNDRWVAAVDRLPARFHAAGVRVVNMSWGYTADEIAEKLMRYGGVTDQAAANARAQVMWTKADAAMRRLLAACPDILFVNAAGNSNQTDEILSSTPQMTGARNLLVVGATGLSGVATSFTTYGAGVGIYAWGEMVPLRVPGGTRMYMSGTSMAAPLVTRAAAQMLAVNPKLTPQQLITGLSATGTPSPAGLKLLHAARAVEWARGTGQ